MMQGKGVFGLAVMICLWLVWNGGSVREVDPEPFEATQLERFPRAIPLPEVSLPDLEGKKVSLRSFKGQVVLMNFWTTW